MLKLNHFLLKTSSFNIVSFEASSSMGILLTSRKTKRGDILSKFIQNKDKNKKWHFQILQNAPNAKSVFEKIHRPHRRQNVLDSLFIKNITDVLSTGDVAPEIVGFGVEITGVRVSPCCKLVNVYWQIPPDSYREHKDIAKMLTLCAPRLRAELISRNVLGKVPLIFFIRDLTNEKVAEFENALRDADFGPENERSIMPDDSFTKKILSFKSVKVANDKESCEQKYDIAKSTQNSHSLPQRPHNMKCDIFGINHDAIMQKIITLRTKSKCTQNSSVISSENFPSAELFDKIPGTPIQIGEEDREKLLKQFQVQREMMRKNKVNMKLTKEDCIIDHASDDQYEEYNPVEEDYIDDDTPDSPFH